MSGSKLILINRPLEIPKHAAGIVSCIAILGAV